jgi:outer membrane protein OmpA-like peptidoglycan-associated protein
VQFVPGHEDVLQRLRVAVQQLPEIAHQAGIDVRVPVIGHTDATGSEGRNLQLSQQRAERTRAALVSHNPAGLPLTTAGVGSTDLLHAATSEGLRMLNRRVTFQVILKEPPNR